MQVLNSSCPDWVDAVSQDLFKDIFDFLIAQRWHESMVNFIHYLLMMLKLEIGEIGVNHQVHEV